MRGAITKGFLIAYLMVLTVSVVGQNASNDTATVPVIRAAAAIVMDAASGKVLYTRNPDKPLPPASTTKIATGLLLAQSLSPNQPVKASADASATPGSTLGMAPGETFTARDLLYSILLHSANDASMAAAESMSKNQAEFAEKMNALARQAGAKNTHFLNPHGLPESGHLSTARDLALLAKLALQNPAFAAAVRTRNYIVPRAKGASPTRLLNKNTLLWTFPGMDGVKTGWTREAGYCFVGSATHNGRRLITVVLNSPDWQGETAALLRYGFQKEGQGEPQENLKKALASSSHPLPASVQKSRNETPDQDVPSTIWQDYLRHPAPFRLAIPEVTDIANAQKKSSPLNPSLLATGTQPGGRVPGNGLSGRDPSTRIPGATTDITHPTTATDGMPSINGVQRPIADPKGSKSPTGGVTAKTAPVDGQHVGNVGPDGKVVPGRGGYWVRFKSKEADGPRLASMPPWFWWLLLAILLILLLNALVQRILNGGFNMNLAALFRRRGENRESKNRPLRLDRGKGTLNRTVSSATTETSEDAEQEPQFAFTPPPIRRRSAEEWMKGVLETPMRLLEPTVRRQARAIIGANPTHYAEPALALLSATAAQVRLAGAELVAAFSPRRSEETILAALNDSSLPVDVRTEAAELLAEIGGDRHEPLWTQMLLRDGFAPAARALCRLPHLDEATKLSLQRGLTSHSAGQEDLKANLRDGHIACVMASHDLVDPEEAKACLERLPVKYREQVLTTTLRGNSSRWAVERLTEIALHGHAFPALQALVESDPSQVAAVLKDHQAEMHDTKRTRPLVINWLLMGEGETETLRHLAEAGDDLAQGALTLGQTSRWNPYSSPPDVSLAAAHIHALRLGCGEVTQEQVALALKAATSGENIERALAQTPHLQPIAEAYAEPMVYEAVQAGLRSEDGLETLLGVLARSPQNPEYRKEMEFWSDKVSPECRLLLLNALQEGGESQNVIAERACDPNEAVRSAALRAMRGQSITSPEQQKPSVEAVAELEEERMEKLEPSGAELPEEVSPDIAAALGLSNPTHEETSSAARRTKYLRDAAEPGRDRRKEAA